jgi:hypothetical protein
VSYRRSLVLYLAAGLAVAALLAAADGARGLRAGCAAWVICVVPLLRREPPVRVAEPAAAPRISRDRRDVLIRGWGALFRLGWVLAGATLLYAAAGDRLGIGFWVAVVVFYQTALALFVARLIAAPPRAP